MKLPEFNQNNEMNNEQRRTTTEQNKQQRTNRRTRMNEWKQHLIMTNAQRIEINNNNLNVQNNLVLTIQRTQMNNCNSNGTRIQFNRRMVYIERRTPVEQNERNTQKKKHRTTNVMNNNERINKIVNTTRTNNWFTNEQSNETN